MYQMDEGMHTSKAIASHLPNLFAFSILQFRANSFNAHFDVILVFRAGICGRIPATIRLPFPVMPPPRLEFCVLRVEIMIFVNINIRFEFFKPAA